MDYKKKYEEAERLYRTANADQRYVLESLFPKLRESDDERIRKEIINYFAKGKEYLSLCSIGKDDIIAWLEKQGERKPADKVEPKFKVKYAGSEYNVFETKDIAGVAFYGIEDEPNHIDYVQAENCERVDGYSIKESGSPFPTKPAKFSEQKPAWSEEDEEHYEACLQYFDAVNPDMVYYKDYQWLKSLKDRYTWKPSDEQMELLREVQQALLGKDCHNRFVNFMYELKRLREE